MYRRYRWGAEVSDQQKLDDGLRGTAAVSVSVRDEGDGRFRVIIDDLKRGDDQKYPRWETHCFVTWATMSREELCEFKFTDEQALGLGQTVIARLGALMSGQESESV